MSSFVGKLVARRLAVAIVILGRHLGRGLHRDRLLPADVAQVVLGQSATPEAVAGLRAAMHLDRAGVSALLSLAARPADGQSRPLARQ